MLLAGSTSCFHAGGGARVGDRFRAPSSKGAMVAESSTIIKNSGAA